MNRKALPGNLPLVQRILLVEAPGNDRMGVIERLAVVRREWFAEKELFALIFSYHFAQASLLAFGS